MTPKSTAMTDKPFNENDGQLVLAHVLFAFAALLLGGIAGLLQGLVRGGAITLPHGIGYYQLLTAHGVLMALIFTTYFIIGFLYSGVAKTTGRLLPTTLALGWTGFLLMSTGTAVGTIFILLNKATVLYTFYAPMKASPYFYVALALVVVGSWLSGYGIFYQYNYWRKTHKGQRSPLFSFMSVVTMLLGRHARRRRGSADPAHSVVVRMGRYDQRAAEPHFVLVLRPPARLFLAAAGLHLMVVIIPKIIGGRIYSDALARLSFLLLFVFSIPVGFHHQLMEPGIPQFWKFLQVALTLMVVVPSLMTAFSLFATLELAGRAKGARGLFGWLKVLPWNDVRFFAPFMGMLIFIPAGAGGVINASYQLDEVVHNTLWVTGHFHLTVATSVALTFFGIAYWLIPAVTYRRVTPRINKLGLWQTWIWVIGMFFMSGSMHTVGLLGAPRRTAYTTYGDNAQAAGWIPYDVAMAAGGMILFVGVLLMIYNICALLRAPVGYEECNGAKKLPIALQRPGVPYFLKPV